MERRQNPERLLKKAQAEEKEAAYGKLKIYFGAAPGVGKTYSMLEDALEKREQGLDIVIGIVESHKRQEIELLAKKFETIPAQEINYHGKILKEFDLDATLKRNPALVLVDEMAHTNAPTLRHRKRWQDIKELLDRGIDVYTTLNVQHVESLNDIVSQITHIRINETVPDSMLELANTIELVDLPPEDLLKRLEQGKVYIPEQAELAIEHFFRKGNLIALRELALRFTAERVGAQVFLHRQGQGIKQIWPTKEKILVCVGPDATSIRLIRAAKRMSASLQAEWIAVHIDKAHATEENRLAAIQNLRIAEQLGGETRILSGLDLVKTIINFAREKNITKIIIGKHIYPRWQNLFRRRLVDEIVRDSGEIDVYIITSEDVSHTKLNMANQSNAIHSAKRFSFKYYLIAFMVVGLITLFNYALYPYVENSNLILLYMAAVVAVALFGKTWPTLLAALMSVILYHYFFTSPSGKSIVWNIQFIFSFLIMLVVGQIISRLTALSHWESQAAQTAERHTAVLHTLSRQLASTRGINKLLDVALRCIADIFKSEITALLQKNDQLYVAASFKTTEPMSAKEMGVAKWVNDLGQPAGLGTNTLPSSDSIYVPLMASQGAVGVLKVHPMQPDLLLIPEEMHLLEICANQLALALEVDRLQDENKNKELKVETDRVRNSLLQSVSHDLRTPILTVMGAANTLMETSSKLDTKKIKKLATNMYFELEQLNRLINNLLQMTYLETESVKLQKELYSLQEVISLVLNNMHNKLGNKPVHQRIAANLPKIPLDINLMQEVFFNLLDNAIKFTPEEAPIDIVAYIVNDDVVVCVEDRGPGIVPDEVKKLFEKYYRGRLLTSERGLGLGLAICRSIIKVHGGDIWAENRPDGGASFRFTLPLIEH